MKDKVVEVEQTEPLNKYISSEKKKIIFWSESRTMIYSETSAQMLGEILKTVSSLVSAMKRTV